MFLKYRQNTDWIYTKWNAQGVVALKEIMGRPGAIAHAKAFS